MTDHPEIRRRTFLLGATTALAGLGLRGRAAAQSPAVLYPDVVGETSSHVVEPDETLLDIARAHDLGYTELVAANPGIDPWLPGEGTRLVLPTAHLLPLAPREGLVLNLADQRLYQFPGPGKAVRSMPVGIGQQGWRTPLGRTTVVRKRANPSWFVPESIRAERPELPAVVKPGPDNPLGTHALYLGWPGYLIHGTNKPWGVGRRVSHGCVRLYPEDIARLYAEVEVGTPVTVVDQPAKLGRLAGVLLLEIHPSQHQADLLEREGRFEPERVPELEYRVLQAAGPDAKRIDWPKVRRLVRERRGMPVPILKARAETARAETDGAQAR